MSNEETSVNRDSTCMRDGNITVAFCLQKRLDQHGELFAESIAKLIAKPFAKHIAKPFAKSG